METLFNHSRSGVASSREAVALIVIGSLVLLAAPVLVANAEEQRAFDHYRTRFPLVAAHERVACEDCHRGGIFEGTPTRCALCHDGSGFRAQTSKDFDHILSTDDCDDCHLANAWVPSRVDHGAVRATCFRCHNGADAGGKNQLHVPSGNDCELCHSTSRWTGARFDHFSVTTACANCHQKDPGHVASPPDCELCHNTRDWEDAQFDHAGITAPCTSCHSGDVPSGHFVTADDCSECHTTNRWHPSTFRHKTPDYPGDHSGHLACTECHQSNSPLVIWPRLDLKPFCAGCHAADFATHEHKNKQTGQLYTVNELKDCTISCHVEDDGRPEHRVGAGDW